MQIILIGLVWYYNVKLSERLSGTSLPLGFVGQTESKAFITSPTPSIVFVCAYSPMQLNIFDCWIIICDTCDMILSVNGRQQQSSMQI